VDRLGQVFVEAFGERVAALLRVAEAGYGQGGQVAALRLFQAADAADEREPVVAGDHEVAHQHARRRALQRAQRVLDLGHGGHVRACAAQEGPDDREILGVVVDEKDRDSLESTRRDHGGPPV
jgi:hypothetical protein